MISTLGHPNMLWSRRFQNDVEVAEIAKPCRFCHFPFFES